MLKIFRKLFPKSKAPVPSTSDRDAFLRQLADADIFILAAMQSEGIDPNGMTKEQLLEEIRRGVEDLDTREAFAPFVYDFNEERRLPFFMSEAHAHKFIGKYSMLHNRVYPFQMLGIKGALLLQALSACDALVMNDGSEDEVVFSSDDMQAARRIWAQA